MDFENDFPETSTPNRRNGRPQGPGERVTAVLGPTNTGKTHLAIERMVAHQTGIIGLPLRLLAREVYDRVVAKVGEHAVALITGEEKIIPPRPRYYVSTVEAMPLDIEVEFLAVDEIQLAAHYERGHVFTQKLLTARGTHETMMLGAMAIRPLIERLLPGTNFITRPRFSSLTNVGPKKIGRLPRRSAIVAFSADGVYALAEMIRRQRGGAAVVLGALSPRTRNAQIELYQNGDVDFIVATDAIGMGLNMNVDHVAFSAARKFDGAAHRNLTASELAQIAGRAGRHMNNGTFGVTHGCKPLEDELITAIETHKFDALKSLQWRNDRLEFASLDTLQRSLTQNSQVYGLVRTRMGSDLAVLEALVRSDQLRPKPSGPAAVKTLWETCQIPDYRKIGIGHHADMVAKIYNFVISDSGHVPEDWMERQLTFADRTDGDIDTLANRISHVRTWTFVSNRSHWLKDAAHWQEKTRAIEDRLSDALHERLTQRFVDRRTSVLMKRLNENETLAAGVSEDGDVTVEGEFVGKLDGLRFALDTGSEGAATQPGASDADTKALRATALKILPGELGQRAAKLVAEDNVAFALTDSGYLTWRGAPVARLEGSELPLQPRFKLLADEQLTPPDREAVEKKLDAWLTQHIKTVLGPIFALEADPQVTGLAQGVGFRVAENLGLLAREDVAGDVHLLDQPSRATLRRHGLRFGAFTLFFPLLLKPKAASLRLMLFKLNQEAKNNILRDDWPEAPSDGLTSFSLPEKSDAGFYGALGYRICGTRGVRADMLERLGDTIRPLVNWKPSKETDVRPEGSHATGGFTVTPTMMSLVGCSGDEFAEILTSLGFVSRKMPPPVVVVAPVDEPAAEATAGETEVKTANDETTPTPQAEASPEVASADVPANDDAEIVKAEAQAESEDTKSESVVPVPSTPSPETVVASPTDVADAKAPETAGPEAEKDAEELLIDVWRPKSRRPKKPAAHRAKGSDQGQNRGKQDANSRDGEQNSDEAKSGDKPRRNRNQQRRHGQSNNRSADGSGNGKPRGQSGSRAKQDGNKPPRRNGNSGSSGRKSAEFVKDSPFAALKALKDSMEKGKSGN